MTAEIAILNKNAIALAADSAVTLQQADSAKIYNTANKLFMLSKHAPVGIMIYGSAAFMHIPWETVIKMYRSHLGEKHYNHLEEYANDFISFLEEARTLFPESAQEEYYAVAIEGWLVSLRDKINKQVNEIIKNIGSISDPQIEKLANGAIGKQLAELDAAENLPNFTDADIQKLADKYGSVTEDAIKRVFEKLPIDDSKQALKMMCAFLFGKEKYWLNPSGVVIAGFGESDVFPRLRTYDCQTVVNNKLRYRYIESRSNEIQQDNTASIIPFAQTEMVMRFMEGVDPSYLRQLHGYLRTLLEEGYPDIVKEALQTKIETTESDAIKQKLRELGGKLVADFETAMKSHRREYFVSPILATVAALPIEELAAMAESLVNLTSLKRRITSSEAETVGGPVDVAVISKGDGFIWIKRKHYFDPKLNHAFFANYYMEHEVANDEQS